MAPETPTMAVDVPEQEVGALEPSEQMSAAQATTEPTPESIAAELAEKESGDTQERSKPVAEMKRTSGLDLSIFTPEQLAALKEAIDATGAVKPKAGKKGNPLVELHELEGLPIVDYSNCYKKSVFDEEQQKQVVRTHIKVKLLGEDKWREVMYREFQQSPRVVCEVVDVAEKHEEKEIGEVWSAQHKVMVPNVIKYTKRTLTIKLPDGQTLVIPAEKVNQ